MEGGQKNAHILKEGIFECGMNASLLDKSISLLKKDFWGDVDTHFLYAHFALSLHIITEKLL